eukprot:scaffold1051_cov119-Cylindrotheca_fusiformis.AAC.14
MRTVRPKRPYRRQKEEEPPPYGPEHGCKNAKGTHGTVEDRPERSERATGKPTKRKTGAGDRDTGTDKEAPEKCACPRDESEGRHCQPWRPSGSTRRHQSTRETANVEATESRSDVDQKDLMQEAKGPTHSPGGEKKAGPREQERSRPSAEGSPEEETTVARRPWTVL